MPFEKGKNKTGGREQGSPNKVTRDAREVLKLLMDGEVERIKESLDIIREEDHNKYLNVLEKFMSYIVPKKRDITSNDESIVPHVTITESRDKTK